MQKSMGEYHNASMTSGWTFSFKTKKEGVFCYAQYNPIFKKKKVRYVVLTTKSAKVEI
jgi:hypothetical protein